MSEIVFKRADALEAIEKTLSQGQSQEERHNWLYDNYPAFDSQRRKSSTGFLSYNGHIFPVKPLGRLANEIAGTPMEENPETDEFRNHFRDLDFQLTDGKGGAESPPVKALEIVRGERREYRLVEVLNRPEQARFRKAVFERYGCVCAISGCKARVALEAAHIVPVSKRGSDKASNGIPLRADIHRIFDAGRLNIDPIKWRLILNPIVAKYCPDSGRWKISRRFTKANHSKSVIAELRRRSLEAGK